MKKVNKFSGNCLKYKYVYKKIQSKPNLIEKNRQVKQALQKQFYRKITLIFTNSRSTTRIRSFPCGRKYTTTEIQKSTALLNNFSPCLLGRAYTAS